MPYAVQTSVFEGPFDLLLHLITKDEVDLYEVSLSDIVDGYLAELNRMDSLDLEVATEFLLIASILIELKSRRLLPGRDDIDMDEEVALWEERDFLLARLLECKTFKDAAEVFEGLMRNASRNYPRTAGLDEQFIALTPDPLAGTSPERLRSAYLRSTRPKPVPQVDLFHVTPVKFTVAETVGKLAKQLPEMKDGVDFRTLTAECEEPVEIVVYFLAVLELYKQNFIDVEQVSNFGQLKIVWTGEGPELGRSLPMTMTDETNSIDDLDDIGPIDEESELQRAVESLVLVAEEPLSPALMADVLGTTEARIDEVCEALIRRYAEEGHGFVMAKVAGGYRYQTHADCAPYVERLVLEGQVARLSGAALETMAIIAYKQPVSKAQLAAIRGVNVDAVVKTLEAKGYIAEIARDEGPGQAILLGTTPLFLERLGLDSLEDLPPLGDFMPPSQLVDALERGLAIGDEDPRSLRSKMTSGEDALDEADSATENAE